MNYKRFIIAVVVCYIAMQIMDFIIHAVMLGETYQLLAGTVMRTGEDMKMWPMYVCSFIFILMFVLIYTHGVKGKGIIEGVRYGIYIGLLYCIYNAFGQWAVYPISAWLAWMWVISGLIEMIILGLIVGAIYKPAEA